MPRRRRARLADRRAPARAPGRSSRTSIEVRGARGAVGQRVIERLDRRREQLERSPSSRTRPRSAAACRLEAARARGQHLGEHGHLETRPDRTLHEGEARARR